jgi:hypothetical protein
MLEINCKLLYSQNIKWPIRNNQLTKIKTLILYYIIHQKQFVDMKKVGAQLLAESQCFKINTVASKAGTLVLPESDNSFGFLMPGASFAMLT